VAACNLYPSTRGSELDDIGSSAIQVLDHAPLHRAPVRRVIQSAGQLHGNGFGLAGHLRKSDSRIAALLADDANSSVFRNETPG
jgi:hypothetical protein